MAVRESGVFLELGFDAEHVIIVATAEEARQYIESQQYNIVCVVNRLTGVDLAALIAGLPILETAGTVATVVVNTARDLEVWL